MSVTPDGWLIYAERLPGPANHTNSGVNPVKGIFMHSAEGYLPTLLDPRSQWGYNGNHSWHLTNAFDGRLYQHYPLTAKCWHATAANEAYIGVENEGDAPKDPTLTPQQIATARRFIGDIAAWKGWTPKRAPDLTQTLWEHREVTRLGGSGSECPSRRIPWDAILAPTGDDDMFTRLNAIAPALQGRILPTTVTLSDFSEPIPAGTKRLRIEVYLAKSDGAEAKVKDSSGAWAGQIGWDGARYGCVEVDVSSGSFTIDGRGALAQVGVVAVQ